MRGSFLRRMRLFGMLAVGLGLLGARAGLASDKLPAMEQLLDIRPLSMGGATFASAASNPSLYTNPAGIAAANVYHVELMYQYGSEINSSMGGGSIVDSVTSPYVGAGLGFLYKGETSSIYDHGQYDVRLGLAGAIADIFMIGAGVKYMNIQHGGRGPNGRPSLNYTGEALVNTFTLDAGLIFRPFKFMAFAVTGQNLTDTDSAYAPIRLVPAVAFFISDIFVGEFDFVTDFTSHTKEVFEYRGGLEVFVADVVPIRAGYFYRAWDEMHYVTGGIGYVGPDFGIEAGVSQGVVQVKDTTIGLSVRIFIN